MYKPKILFVYLRRISRPVMSPQRTSNLNRKGSKLAEKSKDNFLTISDVCAWEFESWKVIRMRRRLLASQADLNKRLLASTLVTRINIATTLNLTASKRSARKKSSINPKNIIFNSSSSLSNIVVVDVVDGWIFIRFFSQFLIRITFSNLRQCHRKSWRRARKRAIEKSANITFFWMLSFQHFRRCLATES